MLQVEGPRSALVAIGLISVAALSACGSSRKLSDERPLCERCHGGASGNQAPPRAVDGATATTDPGVGAHQAHVVAGRLRGPIPCGECHVVPANMEQHEAGIAAIVAGTAQRVVFGALAAQGATGAAFDATGTQRCSNTYCHGATLNHGGSNHAPKWTVVDAGHTEAACGTCHFEAGEPFPPGHPTGDTNCNACHPESVLPGNTAINLAGGKHMNGAIDGGCTSCHAAPPGDRGHQIHASPSAVIYGDTRLTADFATPATTTYVFGCGNCHPLSLANHFNGAVNVTLDPAGAPAGSLRSSNDPAAAYDSVAKSCSGVYCHSSGQATPAYVTSPAWNGAPVPASERCARCHANPPRYASGGAGTATANSHLGLINEGGKTFETGHFGGFPAAVHDGSFHGNGTRGSSPITCQSCHADTVDATNTGPSGFYYLDTSGDYDLAGTGDFCFGGTGMDCTGGTVTAAYACTQCHDGTTAPQGTGKVMPFLHVNGARDVTFDTRATRPGTPDRPYWYGPYGGSAPTSYWAIGGDALADGVYLSLRLPQPPAAPWNSATKTCSGIACHFNLTSVRWGELLTQDFGGCNNTCATCHSFAQPSGCP